MESSTEISKIVIDLVNEDYDNIDEYKIPSELTCQAAAVFNGREIGKVIGDKKTTNGFLAKRGIVMPRMKELEDQCIFSNARFGSQSYVSLHEHLSDADQNRYNTEFIDTRVQFQARVYFTAIRLMCIGSELVQVYVRARDEEEDNPSVHTADTPKDRELLKYLHRVLVTPRLADYRALAEKIGLVLGPGFYAHDVLIERDTGRLLICETGFKFYNGSYSRRMIGILDDRRLQSNVMDQESYAAYAASVFIAYCAKMEFI